MEVTLTGNSLQTRPGDRVETSVEIYNDEAAPISYNISLEGLARSWYEISTVSASLYPGDSTWSTVSITPPRDSSSTAMTYAFRVIVSPLASPAAARRISGKLVLEPFHSSSAELAHVTSDRRNSAYVLKIQNDGNIALPVQLSGQDPVGLLNYHFDREAATIGPGESIEIGLTVTPKGRPLLGHPRACNFLVKAINSLAGAMPELLMDSVTIHPRVPIWIFLLFLIVMATAAITVGVTVVAESYW